MNTVGIIMPPIYEPDTKLEKYLTKWLKLCPSNLENPITALYPFPSLPSNSMLRTFTQFCLDNNLFLIRYETKNDHKNPIIDQIFKFIKSCDSILAFVSNPNTDLDNIAMTLHYASLSDKLIMVPFV